jgi:o-succinylbenzoate synthase
MDLYSSSLPLPLTIHIKRQEIPSRTVPREGLFIHIQHAEREFIVEASPFPILSQENLDQVEEQLHQIIPALQSGALQLSSLYPSLAFALDSALFFLKSPLITPLSFTLCGLVRGSNKEILKKAAELKNQGYTHVKLKTEGRSPQELFPLVKMLQPLFRLRLDFNRSWTLSEALEFFELFPFDAFDYAEEPLQNPADLPRFSHPFALDETLRSPLYFNLKGLPHLRALVLKPTLLGGFSALTPFLSSGKPIVWSSCFESDIGLRQIIFLAHRSKHLSFPLGLDTFSDLNYFLGANLPHFVGAQGWIS